MLAVGRSPASGDAAVGVRANLLGVLLAAFGAAFDGPRAALRHGGRPRGVEGWRSQLGDQPKPARSGEEVHPRAAVDEATTRGFGPHGALVGREHVWGEE